MEVTTARAARHAANVSSAVLAAALGVKQYRVVNDTLTPEESERALALLASGSLPTRRRTGCPVSRVVPCELSRRREALGWSRAELARQSGFWRQAVMRAECGRALPSTVAAMMRAMEADRG